MPRRVFRRLASSAICLPTQVGIRLPSTITASFPARVSTPRFNVRPVIKTAFMPEHLKIVMAVIAATMNRPQTRTMRRQAFRRPVNCATRLPTHLGTRRIQITVLFLLSRESMRLWTAQPVIKTEFMPGLPENATVATAQITNRPETRTMEPLDFRRPVKFVIGPPTHPGTRLDSITPGFPSPRAGTPGMTVRPAIPIPTISRCSVV